MAVRCLGCQLIIGRGKITGTAVCTACIYQRKLEALLHALNWKNATLELSERQINYML